MTVDDTSHESCRSTSLCMSMFDIVIDLKQILWLKMAEAKQLPKLPTVSLEIYCSDFGIGWD